MGSSTAVFFYNLFFIPIFVLFVWSYLATVFTGPGHPSHNWKEHSINDIEVGIETMENGDPRYCEICHDYKPNRTHHCSTCNKCILKMDHHCAWINGCVGFRNHKFFLLFIFYGVLLSSFVGASVYHVTDMNNTPIELWPVVIFHGFLLIAAALLYGTVMAVFLTYQLICLVLYNKSGVEFLKGQYIVKVGVDLITTKKSIYSTNFKENFVQVFGYDQRWWFVPIFTSLGDGYSFPSSFVSGATVNKND